MNPPTLSPSDLLTTSEAAEVLQVNRKTVQAWADNGSLASVRTPGGHRRFRRSDVDALLAPVPPASPSDEGAGK